MVAIGVLSALILSVVLVAALGYGFLSREWDDLDPYWDDDDV